MNSLLQSRGHEAERLVADHLRQQGYTVLEHNYRTKTGEIDIILKKNDLIAFVEVKMRSAHYFNLSLVVDRSKQQKIIKTALHYAARNHYTQHVLRFDVALVEPGPQGDGFVVSFIPNAFTAPEQV